MKITIGVIFVIGLILLGLAKWSESRESNPDDYASAFVILAAMALLAADAALLGIYGLYRLFTS